jgi:hypothetical protein
MSTTVTAEPIVRTTTEGRYGRAGLAAGVLAGAANTAVAAIADAAGVSLAVPHDGDSIPLIGFAQITVIAALVGVAIAFAARRCSDRPARLFTRVAVGLTALSMVPPFLVGAKLETSALLVITHLIPAVVVIPAIARRLRG